MFGKLLIADRGTPALCVLRACRELGIRTVAVHSEGDRDLACVRLADESVCIGPDAPEESYLNVAALISAAELTDAEAIHPGWGPLADDGDFADAVEASGFRFVGSGPAALRVASDRVASRATMRDLGMPSVPHYERLPPASAAELADLTRTLGFPVIVKDRTANRGRTPQIVHTPANLILALNQLQAQARRGAGRCAPHIERYFEHARHVQVQVLADGRGRAAHLGTRDVSIRHERRGLLAEAPAGFVPAARLADVSRRCVDAAIALGLRGAATFDLLLQAGQFHFLAVAPRLDPAYFATAEATSVDLVAQQILIAADEPALPMRGDVVPQAHAVTCQLNAEHPFRFVPSTGRIAAWLMPGGPGIRVDSHCGSGVVIRQGHPNLLGNLTAAGRDRAQAIARMRVALGEAAIEGVRTNLRLHQGIMEDDSYRRGGVYVGYLDEQIARRYRPGRSPRRT